MKKFISLSALVLILSLGLASCKKHDKRDKTTYQTIEITLDENKSYQYNFGTEQKDLAITAQSKAYLVSEIDKSSEVSYFKYMPQLNFVGSDQVQVTMNTWNNDNDGEHHDGGEHYGGGNCQNHHDNDDEDDNKTIYTFKFTVNKVVTAQILSQRLH